MRPRRVTNLVVAMTAPRHSTARSSARWAAPTSPGAKENPGSAARAAGAGNKCTVEKRYVLRIEVNCN